MHSSVAFVLFVISLTGAGLVGLPLALTLVLGANVGGGLVALGLAAERAGRRRAGCSTATSPSAPSGRSRSFLALGPITAPIGALGGDPGRLAAHFHTLFNLGARRRLPAADRPRGAAARAALPRAARPGARRRGSTTSTRRCSTARRWR